MLTRETLDALTEYDWPGNIRVLRNAIERAVIVSGQAREIAPHHIAFGTGTGTVGGGGEDKPVTLNFSEEPTLEDLRASYLQFLLERHDGNRRKVASILGISERNAFRLIPRLKSNQGAVSLCTSAKSVRIIALIR